MLNWSWPDAKGTIAAILVLSLIILIALLIKYPDEIGKNAAVLAVLNMLVGGLIANTNTVIQYYFGSSAESKTKGDVIASIASQTGNGAPKP